MTFTYVVHLVLTTAAFASAQSDACWDNSGECELHTEALLQRKRASKKATTPTLAKKPPRDVELTTGVANWTQDGKPAPTTSPHPAWYKPRVGMWLGFSGKQQPPGRSVYELRFDLPCCYKLPKSFELPYSVDNALIAVTLNGIPLDIGTSSGFTSFGGKMVIRPRPGQEEYLFKDTNVLQVTIRNAGSRNNPLGFYAKGGLTFAPVVRDETNDGKKCGMPGDANRNFDLRGSDATEVSCKGKCEETVGCLAFSGIWGSWCIGCVVPLSAVHTGAIAYKKDWQACLYKIKEDATYSKVYKTGNGFGGCISPSTYQAGHGGDGMLDSWWNQHLTKADCEKKCNDNAECGHFLYLHNRNGGCAIYNYSFDGCRDPDNHCWNNGIAQDDSYQCEVWSKTDCVTQAE